MQRLRMALFPAFVGSVDASAYRVMFCSDGSRKVDAAQREKGGRR
jgi:hypothetical protein